MRTKASFIRVALCLGAVVAVGCSSTSGTPRDAASGGTGGAAGGSDGGAAGSSGDGAADHASGGSGGGGGAAVDSGSDGTDARDGSMACTTSFGAGNPVQFAFNGGSNVGWYQFVGGQSDLANSGLAQMISLGASFTDGNSCPGALQFGVNFTAYGPPNAHGESGQTEYFYSNPGINWTAYKALHGFIKVTTDDYPEIDRVYFYVKSGNQMKYQAANATGESLSNGKWQHLVVDLTDPGTGPFNGVTRTDINLIGFELLLKMAPPAGAPATPTQAVLLVDDIWLEAAPPTDGGADGSADASGG